MIMPFGLDSTIQNKNTKKNSVSVQQKTKIHKE